MKTNRHLLLAFILMIVAASIYRVWPDRPFGFAPQWAIAIFAGAVIKDKKWAFILPLISMFISDTLYQILFSNNQSAIWGFYEGQLTNYILFGSLVFFGIMIQKINWVKIISASLAAPSAFFLLSNFFVWTAGAGFARPKTIDGLMQCYADGVPFYHMSLAATVLFSFALFGTYFLVKKEKLSPAKQIA